MLSVELFDVKDWKYLAIVGIVGSGATVFASSVTYIIPVVAIIWGVIDGEPFEAIYALWIILIVIGVFLVNYNYRRRI